MHNRLKKAAVGGVTVAILGIGALTGQGAFAQSASTPTATTASRSTTATTEQASDAAQYQAFITALGANLGVNDPAKVDAAIRTTLKQMVDDQFTAGNISANEATAQKAAIDASTGADLLKFGGMGEHGGHGKHGAKVQSSDNSNDANDAGNGATDANGTSGNGV